MIPIEIMFPSEKKNKQKNTKTNNKKNKQKQQQHIMASVYITGENTIRQLL